MKTWFDRRPDPMRSRLVGVIFVLWLLFVLVGVGTAIYVAQHFVRKYW